MIQLERGKVNILIGGQFGSEGKGSIAGFLAAHNHIDIAISNGSPNAGHTFIDSMRRVVVHHLPIVGALSSANQIYLGPGSIIDPNILDWEMKAAGIARDRVWIHPRATVITGADIEEERNPESGAAQVASTQHGVGAALAHKIRRDRPLAAKMEKVLPGTVTEVNLTNLLRQGAMALCEVGQGLGLAINSGAAYPYCTAREVSVSQTLSDCMVHPQFLGDVIMAVRTYPIRVGNLYDTNGSMIGSSGPWYADQDELTWEEIGVPAELTTVTKRVRRVATWSDIQYRQSLAQLQPDHIFLNFVNYLNRKSFVELVSRMSAAGRGPDIVGVGPSLDDVMLYDPSELWRRMGW